MDDHPPRPTSGVPSRAPSRQSPAPDLSETDLYIRDILREIRQRLNFTSIELPILDDHQLSGLSDGETLLVPLSCPALNALASMTHQLDTITPQLGNIQCMVATLPTFRAVEKVFETALVPINASLHDLSQRVSAAPPPHVQAPTRAPVPPTSVTTRHTPLPAQARAKVRGPPHTKTPSSSFDLDIPPYDPVSRAFACHPRAYADNFPDSWEANAFREGKYPDPTLFISGHLTPDCPKPQPSYVHAVSKSGSKGQKNKSSLTAAKVASGSSLAPVTQTPRSLPTAERRFYAPSSSPSEYPQAPLIAATFPDIAARVLKDANCILPLAATTKVNDRGSVTLLVSDPASPAAAFAPYSDAITCQLNKSIPVGDSPWRPFRLAPNEAPLAIHSIPIAFLPEDLEELFPSLAQSILNSKNIGILAVRYLNRDAQSRDGKTATSVIISVHPGDVLRMGSSIRLFSRSQTIGSAYSSKRYTQCKNCWEYGLVAPRCPSSVPVCPICYLNHTRAIHRCPNPTWPGGGNIKAAPGGCSSSPPRCVNSGGDHTATNKYCESCLSPPPLWRSTFANKVVLPPPAGDEMDTTTDD